jgi:hypothetical protein
MLLWVEVGTWINSGHWVGMASQVKFECTSIWLRLMVDEPTGHHWDLQGNLEPQPMQKESRGVCVPGSAQSIAGSDSINQDIMLMAHQPRIHHEMLQGGSIL